MKVLDVAGTHSGVGKTTISTALMLAYARRGVKVRAYKVGADLSIPWRIARRFEREGGERKLGRVSHERDARDTTRREGRRRAMSPSWTG